MTPEVERLMATLDGLRAGVVKKLDGLSEADARRSTVPSGTNLAGLLQHLAFVESRWFEAVVAGRTARGIRSMQVEPSTTLRKLRADYRAACAASNEIIAAVGDGDAPVVRNGTVRDLRWGALGRYRRDRPARGTCRHHPRADRRPGRPVILVQGDLGAGEQAVTGTSAAQKIVAGWARPDLAFCQRVDGDK